MTDKKTKSISEKAALYRRRLKKIKPDASEGEETLLDRLSVQMAIAEVAEATISEDGITVEGRYGPIQHPANNILYNANQTILRYINQLQLNVNKSELYGALDLD